MTSRAAQKFSVKVSRKTLSPCRSAPQESNLQSLVERFGQREHLKGIAIYNTAGARLRSPPQ